MAEQKDYLGEKLRLVERAREDMYFRKLDQELLAKMRQEEGTKTPTAAPIPPTFSTILVPVDFSTYSTEALRYAAGIAERFTSSLTVLHVIPRETTTQAIAHRLGQVRLPFVEAFTQHEPPDTTPEVTEDMVTDLREQAYTALQAFLPTRLTTRPVELRVVVGHPFERIIETAVRDKVGLIVLGTHGRTGLAHAMMGSVAERVVRLAPCPVLTVKIATAEEESWLQGMYEKFLPA